RGTFQCISTSSAYAAPRDLHSFPTRRSSDMRIGRHVARLLDDTGVDPAAPPLRADLGAGAGAEERFDRPFPRGACRGIERRAVRSEEHTSELQSRENLVCRLLLEKKKTKQRQ